MIEKGKIKGTRMERVYKKYKKKSTSKRNGHYSSVLLLLLLSPRGVPYAKDDI